MNKTEFLCAIDEILELEAGTLQGDEVLADLDDWDSLAFLSVIAMADEQFDIVIQGEQLEQLTTVDDLVGLVQAHLSAA
jgi:acyl carrier protein